MPRVPLLSRRNFLRSVVVTAGAVACGCARADEPAAGKVRLAQWYHQYGEEGTHEAALRYAQQYTALHPDIEIKVVWVPGNYPAKLSTGLIAGEGPDLFEANLSNITGAIDAGHVLAVDDLLSVEERKAFDPVSLQLNTWRGKLYGIPEVIDLCLLYYRPSLFRSAGLEPPATFDDVIHAAKQLKTPRTKGLFVGNDGGMTALLQVGLWSAGVDLLADGKIAFDVPEAAAVFEKIKELFDSKSLLIGAPTDWWVPAALTENLAAMQWTGLWALKDITAELGDDVALQPWPAFAVGKAGKPVVPISVWAQCINANSAHLAEAKRYARWLWVENQNIQLDWCTAYGMHLPPRSDVVRSAPQLATGLAGQAALAASRYGRGLPPAWTGAMQSILIGALARVIRQNRSAGDEIHLAAQRCAAELGDQVNA